MLKPRGLLEFDSHSKLLARGKAYSHLWASWQARAGGYQPGAELTRT